MTPVPPKQCVECGCDYWPEHIPGRIASPTSQRYLRQKYCTECSPTRRFDWPADPSPDEIAERAEMVRNGLL